VVGALSLVLAAAYLGSHSNRRNSEQIPLDKRDKDDDSAGEPEHRRRVTNEVAIDHLQTALRINTLLERVLRLPSCGKRKN
jgi:hypothetical protein